MLEGVGFDPVIQHQFAALVQHDAYYRDRPDLTFEERSQVNYDHPDSLETELLIHHIEQLRAGKEIERPVYDFSTHSRTRDTIGRVRELYRQADVFDELETLIQENRTFDAVILDLGLPEMEGLDVLKRWRAEGVAVPVLILTARGDDVDSIIGLELGADDYVTKPFGAREVVARVGAVFLQPVPRLLERNDHRRDLVTVDEVVEDRLER